CYDTAPCGHWETVTILSSIRLDGTTESILFEGAVDRKMFKVKQILRGLKPRTSEELFCATGTALGMVNATDAQSWFEYAGYIK
ncbi:MAG: hypothetical protein LBB66_11240, partial [Desulfovibrio sp.]|nr:hypothetical protein [Desulfovibrio sp.]